MPIRWYLGGLALFVMWYGVIRYGLAPYVALPARGVELTGTMLTLLPVALDLVRKLFVKLYAPAKDTGEYAEWVNRRLRDSFLGFEALYAVAIFFGVSLIALGFAIGWVNPQADG